MKKTKVMTGIFLSLILAGCVTQTSPERHSMYFARHDPTMTGGNYVSSPTYTAKLNLPVYQKIYKQGQDAKSRGVSKEHAMRFADDIYQSAVKSTVWNQSFMNLKDHKTPMDPDERAAALWGQTLKDTYLDGYNGIQ